MKLSDFDYDLPINCIAQEPASPRDHSRLMAVRRGSAERVHGHFYDLPAFLREGDVLVINETRVIPARLKGRRETGGAVEILLLARREGPDGAEASPVWEVLLKPAKRVHVGMRILLGHEGEAWVLDRLSDKKWVVQFRMAHPFGEFLERHGQVPLPPYIKGLSPEDRERYQTVYARVSGSVAAPTAGLHFTDAILEQVRSRGVRIVPVTLHIGYGTFLPITAPEVEGHVMEGEYADIGDEAVREINAARRVIAVGTTATRAVESAADEKGLLRPFSDFTGLYIYPGYPFKRVAGLLTNFHLPRSSLFLLVCAFAGTERMQRAYREAVLQGYRFYSYGDCMLIH